MARQSKITTDYQKAYNRTYYLKNKSKLKNKFRANYVANRQERIDKAKNAYRRDPESRWAYMIRYKFGISVEQYKAMLSTQDGVCLICKQPPSGRFKRLAVDHCHKTNKIRGLLCVKCNRVIGYLRDDPVVADAAAAYLRSSL